jgi:hypothetical protein
MAHSNLTYAKKAKKDEFYTQYHDIEKEAAAYLEYDSDVFRGKTILLPCDDPEWSSFTKFFAQNFERFGIKKLISTSYAVESKDYKSAYQPTLFELNDSQFDENKTVKNGKIFTLTHDKTGDGKTDVNDLEWKYLNGDGDFNSPEIKKIRDEADIIITNPPFSLFRDFLAWVVKADKQFLIIGNINAITYKELFPLVRADKLWLGATNFNKGMYFKVPSDFVYSDTYKFEREQNGEKVNRVPSVCWFTNIDHGRRHQPMPLMTQSDVIKFVTKKPFDKYDNYDAIEVKEVKNIPSDYDGLMGVPITFLDKYSPEQFEILGTSDNGLVDDRFKKTPGLTQGFVDDYYKAGGKGAYKEGNPTAGCYENNVAKMIYKRIFIKHKKANK